MATAVGEPMCNISRLPLLCVLGGDGMHCPCYDVCFLPRLHDFGLVVFADRGEQAAAAAAASAASSGVSFLSQTMTYAQPLPLQLI